MAVTAALVKELRERTGAGMMECKKALVEANADIELAIETMRKSGKSKAAKKAGNIAAEGAIIIKEENGIAVLLEVNCQTDFVAKDGNFTAFADRVALVALASRATVEALRDQFEAERVALVAKIGENVNIRRVAYVQGSSMASYRHGEKIGVVVAGKGDAETLKHVAMHVAASRPQYINPEDVPADVVAKEKAVQVEIAMQEGKPAVIAEKMVVGCMRKFTGQISLTGQAFIMEPKKTVGAMLKEKSSSVSDFVRLEVGEGLEKPAEMTFAEEVVLAQKSRL